MKEASLKKNWQNNLNILFLIYEFNSLHIGHYASVKSLKIKGIREEPVAINTLNIYSRLKSTGLSEESAKEIAEVFQETIDEKLATKNDLELVKNELKKEIAESKADTIRWVAGMLVAQAALIATLVKLLWVVFPTALFFSAKVS